MKQNSFLKEWKTNFYNQKLKINTFPENLSSLDKKTGSLIRKYRPLSSSEVKMANHNDLKLKPKTTNSLKITNYNLQTYNRSNQDTCMLHRPVVSEGQWVQKGDLLADCSSSIGGELALGQNIFVAYMPWEGYNYEDAILISERLVYDDIYTSIHIERYEIETRETKFGTEEITRQIPEIDKADLCHLDKRGIIKIGTWVEEGIILVGKVTPTNKKYHSPYQKLLYTILEKEFLPTRDTSLRAPRVLKAKVIDIQIINTESQTLSSFHKSKNKLETATSNSLSNKFVKKNYKKLSTSYKKWFMLPNIKKLSFLNRPPYFPPQKAKKRHLLSTALNADIYNDEAATIRQSTKSQQSNEELIDTGLVLAAEQNFDLNVSDNDKEKLFKTLDKTLKETLSSFERSKKITSYTQAKQEKPLLKAILKFDPFSQKGSKFPVKLNKSEGYSFPIVIRKYQSNKKKIGSYFPTREKIISSSNLLSSTNQSIEAVHIYLAEKRKIQMGDKMAGRHGNKGIVSQVLPRQDMPYLPDGTAIDMVLNPLGVPSRMNVGQIYECLLGLAGKYLGEYFRIAPFDEIYGAEASRSLVYSKLYEVRKKTGSKWVFNPNNPGKIFLYDGRTGESFDQAITVGQAYMLKLVHLVDDKIHARSTGPYSLVTQQPLRGRSKQGGQRLGEMEVWALEGYGAAFTLLEMLTIKSDDMTGRITLWSNIILNKEIYIGTPESFKVLVCELQALCLDIGLFRFDSKGFLKQVEHLMKLP